MQNIWWYRDKTQQEIDSQRKGKELFGVCRIGDNFTIKLTSHKSQSQEQGGDRGCRVEKTDNPFFILWSKIYSCCMLRDFIPANKTFFTFSSFVPSHPQLPFSLSLPSVTSPIFYINILTYINLFHPQKNLSVSEAFSVSGCSLTFLLPLESSFMKDQLYYCHLFLMSHSFINLLQYLLPKSPQTSQFSVSICLVSQQILILLIISHFLKYFSALFQLSLSVFSLVILAILFSSSGLSPST